MPRTPRETVRYCSRCPARVYGRDRYCGACRAAYNREHRAPYRELNDEAKRRATCRAIANVYQQRGVLIPKPCEQAGPACHGPIEKHHDDYDRPLHVRWLCRAHNRAAHRSQM
jgi:hypothetical protein